MSPLEPFARQDVRKVLDRFDIGGARRAADTDSTEEVILLGEGDYRRVDVENLTRELMIVFPHTKVWVALDSPLWTGEPI